MLQSILSPTVIAAVIASAITWLTCKKQQSNSYVTAERAAWRLRLKKAMIALVSSQGKNKKRLKALQAVKCELNPYGEFFENNINKKKKFSFPTKNVNCDDQNKKYYLSDGHIWKTIKNYEETSSDEKERYLNLLLTELGYLLKYDWERSKREVRFRAGGISAFLLTGMGLVLMLRTRWIASPQQTQTILLEICAIAFFLVFTPYLYVNNFLGFTSFIIWYCFAIVLYAVMFLYKPIVTSFPLDYKCAGICLAGAFFCSVYSAVKNKEPEDEYIRKVATLEKSARVELFA